MKEWSTGKKRVVGVVATAVVVYLLYLGATRLWDLVREMHHM
jgi:hypothetical protein